MKNRLSLNICYLHSLMSGFMMADMMRHTMTMMAFLEVQTNHTALFRMYRPLVWPSAALNVGDLPIN